MTEEKTSLIKEFQKFISRGNVIDLAVGIIVGSAFTGIVNSLVKDLIMPPLGLIIGKVNFADFKFVLQQSYTDATGKTYPEVALTYGNFLQNLFNFLIISLVVFALVRTINRFKKKEEEKPAKKAETEISVLKDIRKLLRKRG